ncbi:hypothetical protein ACFPM0_27855 [Pseudonocardia sulfidoxydans]|uniref:hypothetical protein n=1 Tax=Pseudonocardia sulfidoxydans TaxID=54011 RepID=UPI00361599C7
MRLFVRADGGDVELVCFDPGTRTAEVRLNLDAVDCLDCIIPPPMLENLLQDRWSAGQASSTTLLIHDPRVEPAAG